MASARRFWVFILTISTVCLGFGFCQINHERGKSLTFKCNVPGKAESITWKYGNDKIVEWSSGMDTEWFKSQGFTGNLDTKNGDVELYNIQKGGKFTCELQVGGVVKSNIMEVFIWDKPSKPEVTCVRNETQITLHCSVNTTASETVEWSAPNVDKLTNPTLVYTEKIPETSVFFCSAKNPATSTASEFKLEDCKELLPKPTSVIRIVIGILIGTLIVFVIIGVAIWKRSVLVAKLFRENSRNNDALPSEQKELKATTNNTNQDNP